MNGAPAVPGLGRARLMILGASALGTVALAALAATPHDAAGAGAGAGAGAAETRVTIGDPRDGKAPALPDEDPAAGPDEISEAIADRIGCRPEAVLVDADELRQVACTLDGERYRFTSFLAADGRAAWLDEALPYGGSHLVGDRWVVTASRPVLEELGDRLGGRITDGEDHGAHTGHG
ncbi:hypothetical protein GCM10027160_01620 [Streptomyces calidiresistens]|uniref:Lipoprotein n=1 Tax=Streptomyces calidiresistens TaxID=1485586 RepID=A0A7W3T3Z3_9ACTN|nr:hypothetical protein [Streptomyces calidiresistens]MBB0230353.1 hypothetical protein [Streptomyces calidiresistens]